MSGLKSWILPTVTILAVTLDQATKGWIAAHMSLGETREVAPWLSAVFSLTYVTNTGVAFGLLQGMGDVLLVVALIAVSGMFIYYHQLPPGPPLLHVAMGLQLGGALGNLIDRLTRGAVVDFIDLNFWPLHHWPIFNLADASIVTGVALLMLVILTGRDRQPPQVPE